MPRSFQPTVYKAKRTVDEKPKRLYDRKWNNYSTRFKREHPRCRECGAVAYGHDNEGRALGVVDHIIPYKGDVKLFWDESNHQTLCIKCHNRKSAGEK